MQEGVAEKRRSSGRHAEETSRRETARRDQQEREKGEAKERIERQEKANIETKKLLDRKDEHKAEEEISGKTEAGIQKKEDTPQEYATKVLSGEINGKEN